MTLTAAQVMASEAAKRMRQDEHFQLILDHVVAEAVGNAMFQPEAAQRESSRHVVIAVNLIRNKIAEFAEAPEADEARERMARGME